MTPLFIQHGDVLLGIIALLCLSGALFLAMHLRDAHSLQYHESVANQMADSPILKKKRLLTPNEQEFYGRVNAAAEQLGLRVHSQVSMGALVAPLVGENHPAYFDIVRQFSMKIVDYVLEYKGQTVLVIELDDITHDAEKDFRRDKMLFNAGISTLRYHSREKPSVERITADVRKICRIL